MSNFIQEEKDIGFIDKTNIASDADVLSQPPPNCPPHLLDPKRRRSLLQSTYYDPLACWLWNATITIPDQHFEDSFVRLTVQDLKCSHFQLDNIASQYNPSLQQNPNNDPSISLSIANISATCHGNYRAVIVGVYKGNLEITLGVPSPEDGLPRSDNDQVPSALKMQIDFNSDASGKLPNGTAIPMATSITAPMCQISLQVLGLHFDGSASARLIQVFSKTIRHYITSALTTQVCSPLQDLIHTKGSELLQKANHLMMQYITTDSPAEIALRQPKQEEDLSNDLPRKDLHKRESGSSSSSLRHGLNKRRDVITEDDLVNWTRDTPVLSSILAFVNRNVFTRFLNKGPFQQLLSLIRLDDASLGDDDCGFFYNGINGLLDHLVHGQFVVHIPHRFQNVSFVLPSMGKISMHFDKVTVAGLKDVDRLQLLEPHDKDNILNSSLLMENGINVTLEMNVQIASIPGGRFQGDTLVEDFFLSVNTSHLDISAQTRLDLNQTRFQYVTAGHILDAIHQQASLGCCVYPFQSIDLPFLDAMISFDSISLTPISKDVRHQVTDSSTHPVDHLEMDLDAMLNHFFQLFLTEYSELVTLTVRGIVNGPIKEKALKFGNSFLSDLVGKYKPNDSTCAPQHDNKDDNKDNGTDAVGTQYVNFSKAPILYKLNDFLNRTETIDGANGYLNCLGNNFNHRVATVMPQLKLGNVTLNITEFDVQNWGSLERIELLLPENEGYHLQSGIRLGTSFDGPKVSSTIQLSSLATNLSGSFTVSGELDSFAASEMALVLFDLNKFRNLTLAQMLRCAYCAITPTSEVALYEQTDDQRIDSGANFSNSLNMGFNMSLHGNGFPTIDLSLSTSDYPPVASALGSTWKLIQDTTSEVSNHVVSRMIQGSKRSCGGNDASSQEKDQSDKESNDDNSSASLFESVLYLVPLFILAHIFFFAISDVGAPREQQHHQQEHRDEPRISELEVPLLHDDPMADDIVVPRVAPQETRTESTPECSGPSLLNDASISATLRHVFPIVLVATIALLAASNMSVGASVDLTLSMEPTFKMIRIPSLFAFSLGRTVEEMLSAKTYVLLFIVVVFSGIWPYAKLVWMLYTWIAPPHWLSRPQRGRALFLLDALSKFSLVDTFVLVLMMVSFRYHLNLEQMAILDIYVNPRFGFYGFLLATMISLISGHVELYVHRQAILNEIECSNDKEDSNGGSLAAAVAEAAREENQSMITYRFERSDNEGRTHQYKMTLVGLFVLIVLILCTFALLSVGVVKKSFLFEIGGLAGQMLGEERKNAYSLVSLGTSISESVENPSWGILFLQVIYFFYACITPYLCLLALSALLLLPLSTKAQAFMLTVAEVANAWSSIEVFALSIVASLFQISTFAAFMVGDKCDILNAIVRDHLSDLVHDDDVCYSVNSSVAANVWFLILGVVLNSFLVSTLLRVSHSIVEERQRGKINGGTATTLKEEGEGFRHFLCESIMGRFLFEEVGRDATLEPLLKTKQNNNSEEEAATNHGDGEETPATSDTSDELEVTGDVPPE